MAEIPERWYRAETYPIEGFWSTQILTGRSEVACIANGHTEKQSIARATQIVASEARIRELKIALREIHDGVLGNEDFDADWVVELIVRALNEAGKP